MGCMGGELPGINGEGENTTYWEENIYQKKKQQNSIPTIEKGTDVCQRVLRGRKCGGAITRWKKKENKLLLQTEKGERNSRWRYRFEQEGSVELQSPTPRRQKRGNEKHHLWEGGASLSEGRGKRARKRGGGRVGQKGA